MNKITKILLIIAMCLVVTGGLIFVIGMSVNHWNFSHLGAKNFETNGYEIVDDFGSIAIDTTIADIDFKQADDGKCRVVCYEDKKAKHHTAVEDGVLNIKRINKKKWYEKVSLFSGSPKVTVYLPESVGVGLAIKVTTGDIKIEKEFTFESIVITGTTSDIKCYASTVKQTKIKVTTGDIIIDGASAESYDLEVTSGDNKLTNVSCSGEIKLKISTGENYLSNVNCGSLVSTGSTGDIKLKKVIVTNKLSVARSTGDVELDLCDAGELVIKTSTGDVEGILLSEKIFVVRTDTGDIDVPGTITGGKCEIKTNTGDVEFRIANT